MDALDLAIANVQSSIPDVSAFVTSLQVRALIDTSLSDYYNKQAIDGKLADYYTKTEIGNNFYTKTQTDALIPNTSNFVTTTDSRQLTFTNDASQITAHTVSLNLLNVNTAIQKNNQKMIFYSNFVLMQGDYRVGGASNGDWYIRLTGDSGRGAVIGVANSTSSMPSLLTYMSFAINRTIFYYYNDDQTRLFLNSASLNNAKYFSWVYGQSNLSLFSNRIQLSNLSFDTNTVVNSILSSSQTTTPNDTSIPTTLWVQNKLDAIPQTDAYTKTEVDNLIQGIFNKPETFNDTVTFNDAVSLTNTLSIDSKTINTVVRSNDNITPSDTNIPSTLWAQNKFNTKVDNGTVYTKVELNNLLILQDLYVIQLLVDILPPQIIVDTTVNRYFISGNLNAVNSMRLYFSNSTTTINFSGYGLFIRNGRLYFTQNQITLRQGDLYTIQLPSAIKAIKITRSELEDVFCYYTYPFVLGNPIQLPRVININPLPYLNFLTVTLQFKYTLNSTQQTKTYNFTYSDVEVYINHMDGNYTIEYTPDTGAGFYFICNGRYVQNNIIYTTLRCLYLTSFKSYSFTSNTGSIFYIPNLAYNFEPDFGFNFQLSINTPRNGSSWYLHEFTTNQVSPRDKDTNNLIVYGDFALPCGMFYDKITCL